MTYRKTCTVLAACLMTAVMSAKIKAEDTVDDAKKSFLWEVKSETATVYLLGSIHAMTKDTYPLNDTIEGAYKKSSTLVMELNPLTVNSGKMIIAMGTRGVYRDKTLKDVLDEDVYKSLLTYLEKEKMPVAAMERFKPGLLSVTLTMRKLMILGYSPANGIDQHFAERATKDKKPIIELETMEDQLALMFDMPEAGAFLKYTLVDLDNMDKVMDEVIAAWYSGDVEKLNTLILTDALKEYPDLPPVYKRMFFDRNVTMTTKIEGILKTKETYFVVIGAGHMLGDKGIVSLLKKKKFTVRQL